MIDDTDEQIQAAIAGELRLLQRDVRSDRAEIGALLADDFIEVGKTGRLWSRSEMIESLLADGDETVIRTELMEGQVVAGGVVLVRYLSSAGTARAWRSSVWVRSSSGWRVSYHQATLIS